MTMDIKQLEDQLRLSGIALSSMPATGPRTMDLDVTDEQGNPMGQQAVMLTTIEQRKPTYVLAYNTRTGENIPFDVNRLPVILKKTHQDKRYPQWVGRNLFTLDKTRAPEYRRGTMKCPLHPDSPDREFFNELGSDICRKANIPTLLAVENHVKIKHRQTWEYQQRLKQQEIEREEREWRRAFVASQRASMAAMEAEVLEASVPIKAAQKREHS